MTYIVMPNDSLITIAEKFNVSIDDLIRENNLEYIYSLIPGLELIIPQEENQITNNKDSNIDDPIGDIEKDDLQAENTTINNDQNLFSYYIVEKGDNLYQIGKRYNISPEVLAELNGLNIEDYIYPEQQIMVPNNNIGMYITKENDSISEIASNLNILPEELLINNKTIYLKPDQLIVYKK